MNVKQIIAISVAVLVVFLLGAGLAQAQEPNDLVKDPGALRGVLPVKVGGQPIAESQRIWAYIGAIVAYFVIAIVLEEFVIRAFAWLIIIALIFGGMFLLCWLISDGTLTTWPALALTTVCVAAYVAVAIVVVGLFTLQKLASAADHNRLADTVKTQADLLNRLTQELAELKRQLPLAGQVAQVDPPHVAGA